MSLQTEIEVAVKAFAHGWCSPEKAIAISNTIIKSNADVYVELGVYSGRSLAPAAITMRSLGRGVAYGVDPWKKEDTLEGSLSQADKDWWASLDLNIIHNYCMSKIWELGLDQWAVVIRSQSYNAHQLFNEIGVLYVDSTHSEEASCRDVGLYLPKVKAGGYVWCDDIEWAGTKKAQELLGSQCDKVDEIDGAACYLKR